MDEMLFAVSQIEFCTIHRRTSPPPPATNRLSTPIVDVEQSHANTLNEDNGEDVASVEPAATKHLVLLDLLALMLVTGAKSDVAATMLTMGREPKFYYSKNRPLTDDENRYVQEILTCACDTTTSATDRLDTLIKTVIAQCRQKIKSRIKKIVQRANDLEANAGRDVHNDNSLPAETARLLRIQLQLNPSESLQAFIWEWLDSLKSVQTPEQMKHAIGRAYVLGINDQMRNMIDPILLQRIRKVGDYGCAVCQLVGEISRLSDRQRRALTIHEVRTAMSYRFLH